MMKIGGAIVATAITLTASTTFAGSTPADPTWSGSDHHATEAASLAERSRINLI